MAPKRGLVIDDDAMILEFLTFALRSLGFAAIPAAGGPEGIEKAIAQKPDLVLCDIRMPDPDGYKVRQQLAAHPATATVPVLAVTALTLAGEKEKILRAGFQGYLPKPVDFEELARTVKSFLAKDDVRRSGRGSALRRTPR